MIGVQGARKRRSDNLAARSKRKSRVALRATRLFYRATRLEVIGIVRPGTRYQFRGLGDAVALSLWACTRYRGANGRMPMMAFQWPICAAGRRGLTACSAKKPIFCG